MSQFTRRDFIWLEERFAEALIQTNFATDRQTIWTIIDLFANKLHNENPNFNSELFVNEIKRLSNSEVSG